MTIAISSTAPDIHANIDTRFGRCAYFILIDDQQENREQPSWKALENPAINSSGGAGIEAAKYIADQDVKTAISGDFGPNAYNTLKAAEISTFLFDSQSQTVLDVYNQFLNGSLDQK